VWSSRKRLAHDDDAQLARADSNGATLLALPEVRGNFEDAECRRSTIAALVACRTGAGLTQESVAERMGTTQSAVSELEGALQTRGSRHFSGTRARSIRDSSYTSPVTILKALLTSEFLQSRPIKCLK